MSEEKSATRLPVSARVSLENGDELTLSVHTRSMSAGALRERVGRALDAARAVMQQPLEVSSAGDGDSVRHAIVGRSPEMLRLFALIDKVAKSDASVLVTGENGTGKELVARAIHAASPRAKKLFLATNCSALNDNLLESEMFGHRKGAFTGAVIDKRGLFEEADGGTFLLDEVGDMSPALQVKLLRVLQEGTFTPVGATKPVHVDVRIIAATNRDLATLVRTGAFREDLYYRLHVVALHTPPLRARQGDIALLASFFIARLAERYGKIKTLSAAAIEKLQAHSWPGNVRELENEIERAWVLSGPETLIGPEFLTPVVAQAIVRLAPEPAVVATEPADTDDVVPTRGVSESLTVQLERVEREIIGRTLEKLSGNRTHAAQALGISRRNLIRKLQQYGLDE